MDNLEVDSIVFSVTYENYIKNIKQDKQNKTLGEWLIKDEMIDLLKYSYHPNMVLESIAEVKLDMMDQILKNEYNLLLGNNRLAEAI